MALLTAEDVLEKAFSKTKYREGFDQDEVDDFLDEVSRTIAFLTAERDELQARVSQYQAGGAPVVAAAPNSIAGGHTGTSSVSADLLAAATDPNPPSATTMLSMAQKLHDDYLQAGESERDRIIEEGKAKAETIVEQAEKDARLRMQSLDSDRTELERRIDDLRRFERDYRGHLRNYLENLLGDLEHNAARGGAGVPDASTPSVTAPPLFGSASDGESSDTAHEHDVDQAVDHGDQLEPFAAVEDPEPFAPVSQPEPFAPISEPEPFAPIAQPEPFAAVEEPEPFAPFSQPEPFAPAAERAPYGDNPEALPPFPGTAQFAGPFGSPFRDANPFAPVGEPTDTQVPPVEPQAPAVSVEETPQEEAPRWNF